jgi:hypothetical protein
MCILIFAICYIDHFAITQVQIFLRNFKYIVCINTWMRESQFWGRKNLEDRIIVCTKPINWKGEAIGGPGCQKEAEVSMLHILK